MRMLSYLTPGFPPSLFEAFGAVIGAEVEFEQGSSGPEPGTDPFTDGSVDLAWMCSVSYVGLAARRSPTVQLIGVGWVPDDPAVDGKPVYFGDVVARPGSGITSLSDLHGKRIGCNDRNSLSGYHALRFAMRDRGLDLDTYARPLFTGGHHRSMDRLLAGELDAAVIDSVVRIGRARRQPQLAAMHVAERLGPWPVQPLVARSTLNVDRVGEIRRQLLKAAERPDLKGELAAASLAGLSQVGSAHYDSVRSAVGVGIGSAVGKRAARQR